MERQRFTFFWIWLVLLTSVGHRCIYANNEIFDDYNSPQALAMGNAFTADAYGYSALFYNPAGLSKIPLKRWEITPIAIDASPSFTAFGRALGAGSFGLHQTARQMRKNPGQYYYNRFTFVPSVAFRNFGASFLFSHQMAGQSDGTLFDTKVVTDMGPVFGASTNLAGNILKVGISGKVLFRNEVNAALPHDEIDSEQSFKEKMTEGVGAGWNLGMMITLPGKFLPAFGLVWKDVFNTYFLGSSRTLNSYASGRPEPIQQSFNAAISIHPAMGRRADSIIALEFRHIERTDLAFTKKLHIGFQWSSEKSSYFWLGLNQLNVTAGYGLRLPGGNLEIGTYGADTGDGFNSQRFLMRYTIGY